MQPIRNRIDMLATGIKSPVGIKVAGNDLAEIERIALEVEAAVKTVPGVGSVLAERLRAGATSISTSTARMPRATVCPSPICSRW